MCHLRKPVSFYFTDFSDLMKIMNLKCYSRNIFNSWCHMATRVEKKKISSVTKRSDMSHVTSYLDTEAKKGTKR